MDLSNKLSDNLKRCLKEATKTAHQYHAPHVGINFFILALFQQKGSLAYEMLHQQEVSIDDIQAVLVGQPEPAPAEPNKAIVLSPELQNTLLRAAILAQKHNHFFVGTEHCLSVLLDQPPFVFSHLCELYGIDKVKLQTQIQALLRGNSKFPELTKFFKNADNFEGQLDDFSGPQGPAGIEAFATDITDATYQETVNPVINRDREIERMIQILCRKDKNNPVILGEPGVGKTALVEGLAKKILNRDVPPILHNKKILSLDLGLVVAGTMYRGDFEQRLKTILDEVKHNPNVIIFIDELHNLVGAGSSSGTMDAANLLKPLLARGELRCIGATTLDEYKKFIEKDAALERRFQPITLSEPTIAESLTILEGVKENYEKFHHVTFAPEAIIAAVTYSARYLPDKLLPDKAIDLLDEAAAKQKIKNSDNAFITEIRGLEHELEKIGEQKSRAVLNEEFTVALKLKQQEKDIQDKLIFLNNEQIEHLNRQDNVITKHAIIEIVAQKTHIPLVELLDDQRKTLRQLNTTIKSQIVGQDKSIDALVHVITRAKMGLADENRPLASLMILGPSGVGKTLTAKVLAQALFHDKDSFIRIDMSEYSEKFNATKLVGAPAGYVGYREGNKLTDAIKKRPASLLLLDEVDKAHPDVLGLLLQILEEGQLTDATGKTINFKNAIIVMTANLGQDTQSPTSSIGFSTGTTTETAAREEHLTNLAKKHFRPEFINRIDSLLFYTPLPAEALRQIVQLEIQKVITRLATRGLTVSVGSETITKLATQAGTLDVGARGVKRVILDEIEKPITEKLLTSDETTFIFP